MLRVMEARSIRRSFDGIGRKTKSYMSYDASETSYADALTVTGDTVISQMETTYDAAGNSIQTAIRDRLNDATGTADLTSISGSQPKARVTNQAMWFDSINRLIDTGDYGTNGDAALTRPASIPSALRHSVSFHPFV